MRSQICIKTHRCMQYTFISLLSFQRLPLNKHVLLTVLCSWQCFFLLFCSFFFFWQLKAIFLVNLGKQLMLPLAFFFLMRFLGVGKTLHLITLVFSYPEQERRGQLLKYPFSYCKNHNQRVTSSCASIFQLLHVIHIAPVLGGPCNFWRF